MSSGQKTCFVISPIGKEHSETRKGADECLQYIIRPALEKCGYTATRADELRGSGIITLDIIRNILDADLVIADLTDWNPNVMYELAVRHASRKPFLQIIRKGQALPFDIAVSRTMQLEEARVDNVEELKSRIVREITAIEANPDPVETPIGMAIDLQRLQTSEIPEQRSLAELLSGVSEIRSEMIKAGAVAQEIFSIVRTEHEAADSVYQERASHYKEEKRCIAERFVRDVLGKRVKYLRKATSVGRVRIIFDSGSTIAPMLNVLGQEAENNPRHWCRDANVEVVTNNIKGIENMLRYRERKGDRYAKLPIAHFSVLPGEVLAAFEAIADEQTLNALESYRNDGVYTIAVTTGNYILLHDGQFVPIARAGYHPHFKATLYDIASEVYVAAPLGKILTWRGEKIHSLEQLLERLNSDLKYRDFPPEEWTEERRYQLVTEALVHSKQTVQVKWDPSSWLQKSVLVTTRRTGEHCILDKHFVRVETHIGSELEFEADWEVGTGPRIWSTAFEALPFSGQEQLKIEIPHENLRKVAEKYFALPSNWKRYRDEAPNLLEVSPASNGQAPML